MTAEEREKYGIKNKEETMDKQTSQTRKINWTPELRRELMKLKDEDGLTYEQIGEKLGVPKKAAQMAHYRIMQQRDKFLNADYAKPEHLQGRKPAVINAEFDKLFDEIDAKFDKAFDKPEPSEAADNNSPVNDAERRDTTHYIAKLLLDTLTEQEISDYSTDAYTVDLGRGKGIITGTLDGLGFNLQFDITEGR